MPKPAKWVGTAVILLGMVIGAQYLHKHPEAGIRTSAMAAPSPQATVSPRDIMKNAGALPETECDSYF